ncbi:MAG: cryptochrome/photolyase family protein [Bacteroidales bacterium]
MITKKEDIVLFWFRRDLRLDDNAGLFHALQSGLKVLTIFIFDKIILDKLNDKSDARVNFIHQQIELLNLQLKKYNSTLLCFYSFPLDAFKEIIQKYSIQAVYANNDYEPYSIKRDKEISDFLAENGIEFRSYKDQVIFEKEDILKPDSKPYTIYTPYMKRWKQKLNITFYTSFPSEEFTENFYSLDFKIPPGLNELGFQTSNFEFPDKIPQDIIIKDYEKQRNLPILSTTKMGIHLRFGTVSVRKLLQKALILSETWLNELIWREFFQMIIYHFPYSEKHSFKPAYDRIEWHNNEKEFESWCKGETGFLLIDAGMRELNQSGFMHNRVRMLVASFLCKNLLIDWRWGEAYFADKLLDYDLSANVGNWQWAAGSGCDAAPYFRIFSPELQLGKFDKNHEYIKKWIPEYGTKDYSLPILDAKLTAKKAIEVYKKALNQ